MLELLIMADDFTGALDTGIQFAKRGISTQVVCGDGIKELTSANVQVLTVNLETRSMRAEDAYKTVYRLTEAAKKAGIPSIYKKTDSALRGNVGAELKALVDVTGHSVCFIPAYPDAGRTTVGGVQFADGVPIQESVFGKDPFEPVIHSKISEILQEGGQMNVCCIPLGGRIEEKADIYVFDAEKNQDLRDWAKFFKEQGMLSALAGCAGFAAFLTEIKELTGEKRCERLRKRGLYVACGSVNPVTGKQIEYAAQHGFVRVCLNPVQKLCPDYYQTEEGQKFLEYIYGVCVSHRGIIVDTFDEKSGETEEYARNHGIDTNSIRQLIPACHGCILRSLMEHGADQNYFLTGGDTLAGFLKQISEYELLPMEEVSQGVVLSKLMWNGNEEQILTKSGGFGNPDLFLKLLNLFDNSKGEETV